MAKRIFKEDIDRFHDYNLYVPQRTVFMGSEHSGEEESGTDTSMAERQIKNLLILDTLSHDPITIIMNNVGGDTNHGLAIYDAILACKSHVIIKVFGNAMSMGSIILQAADERIMAPNAVQMIHHGSLGVESHVRTVYKIVDESRRIDKWAEKMYLSRIKEKQPHFTLARLQRMLEHDTFLTAEQSVELGLADKILGDE